MAAKKTTKKTTKKTNSSSFSETERKQIAVAKKVITGDKIGLKIEKEHVGPFPCISTGCFAIDEVIGGLLVDDVKGNKVPKCPGYPRKRIVEIYGPESSGKTTVALTAVAQVQKLGGRAIYLDFEHALDDTYAKTLGVSFDEEKLLRLAPHTLEQGFKALQVGVNTGYDLVVIDSVAAMVPIKELEKAFDDEAAVGFRARALSNAIPKLAIMIDNVLDNARGGTTLIFINQIRENIGKKGYGADANENTPGGRALKFHATLRLRFGKGKAEVVERKDPVTGKPRKYPYGVHTDVKVIKNKIAPTNGWSSNFFIRFGEGIDELFTLIECGAAQNVCKKKGGWYEYEGERWQGREAFRRSLLEHSDLRDKLQEAVISKLRGQGLSEEEVSEEELSIIEGAASMEDALDDLYDSSEEALVDGEGIEVG